MHELDFLAFLDTLLLLYVHSVYLDRQCIAKFTCLEELKCLVIWNGGSISDVPWRLAVYFKLICMHS